MVRSSTTQLFKVELVLYSPFYCLLSSVNRLPIVNPCTKVQAFFESSNQFNSIVDFFALSKREPTLGLGNGVNPPPMGGSDMLYRCNLPYLNRVQVTDNYLPLEAHKVPIQARYNTWVRGMTFPCTSYKHSMHPLLDLKNACTKYMEMKFDAL